MTVVITDLSFFHFEIYDMDMIKSGAAKKHRFMNELNRVRPSFLTGFNKAGRSAVIQ